MIDSLTVNVTATRCLCGGPISLFTVGITEINNDIQKQELFLQCGGCGIRISRPMDNMKVNIHCIAQEPESESDPVPEISPKSNLN